MITTPESLTSFWEYKDGSKILPHCTLDGKIICNKGYNEVKDFKKHLFAFLKENPKVHILRPINIYNLPENVTELAKQVLQDLGSIIKVEAIIANNGNCTNEIIQLLMRKVQQPSWDKPKN